MKHMGKKNLAYCYLWDETIAARGGQEIASCIYKYIHDKLNTCKEVEEIIFYSDCCPGQNRNIYMSIMFMYIIATFKENGRHIVIHHKYLIPGHTHMEADTIHAAIEKKKKHSSIDIELPRDWAILISSVQRSPPINVIQMEQKNFFNFKDLLTNVFIHKKVNTNGEPVGWNKIRWMMYTPNNIGIIFYKQSFSSDSNSIDQQFLQLDLTKKTRGSNRNISIIKLQPINTKLLPISKEKLKDLESLLPYIKENSRLFYMTMIQNLSSTSTDNIQEEESD